jgi:hypothetical protein
LANHPELAKVRAWMACATATLTPALLPRPGRSSGRIPAAVGHKVNAIVNYDRFSIASELIDAYIGMVKGVMERHYHDVTRYTSNTFLRMKLGEALEKRQIPPHIYKSANEAQGSLAKH